MLDPAATQRLGCFMIFAAPLWTFASAPTLPDKVPDMRLGVWLGAVCGHGYMNGSWVGTAGTA